MKSAESARSSQTPRESKEITSLIRFLGGLSVGEFAALKAKLAEARLRLESCGLDDLASLIRESADRLDLGDVPGYRKLVAQVLSRLGHLK